MRRATRTVVKKIRNYWEHKSFRFRFERFGDVWTLVMLPGYVFTTDGKSDLLEGKVVNRLSTKREGRDYNQVVHNDLVFWTWVLSEGKHNIFALNTDSFVRRKYRGHIWALCIGNPTLSEIFEREVGYF